MIGDKVTVHYTGRLLNGKKFDCTQDHKEPFSFSAGKGKPIRHYRHSSMFHLNVASHASSEGIAMDSCSGQVLKSWDVGVLSMERGEVAIFLCAPEYAYGVAGNPDKIPPNSAVVFEVGAPAQQFC